MLAKRYAQRWRGMLSGVYEVFILLAIGIGISAVSLLWNPFVPSALWRGLLLQVFLFLGWGIYFGWSWSGGRRTLPMQVWRLHLQREDGGDISYRQAIGRYLCVWLGLVLAWLLMLGLSRLSSLFSLESVFLMESATARTACLLGVWVGLNWGWAWLNPHHRFMHDWLMNLWLVHEPVTVPMKPELSR